MAKSASGARRRNAVGAKKPTKKAPAKSSTKSDASSPFMKAIAKKKGAFKKFKTAPKGAGGFTKTNIKDGTYKTRWSAKSGISKDNKPYVMLNWVVVSGKAKGEKDGRYFDLDNDDHWGWLSGMLQQLLDEDFADLDDNPEELKELLDRVNDERPCTTTAIKRNDQGYINAYIQELVDEDDDDESDEEEDESDEGDEEDAEDSEEDEDESDEDDDSEADEDETDYASLGEAADEGDKSAIKELKAAAKEAELDPNDYETWADLAEALGEPEEDDDSDEESDEDEEEELEPLVKGDPCFYKPKGKRKPIECEVASVNKSKETYKINEVDGDGSWTVLWDDEALSVE
jgi:hypothetical protein